MNCIHKIIKFAHFARNIITCPKPLQFEGYMFVFEGKANNGSSHIIRKHNQPNVLQDVTFNNRIYKKRESQKEKEASPPSAL